MLSLASELADPGGSSTGLSKDTSGPVHPDEIHKSQPTNVWIHSPKEESAHSLSTDFEVPSEEKPLRFVDLVEVQRQAGILQAHRQLGVPEGEVFTLDMIALKVIARAGVSDMLLDSGRVRAQIVATAARGKTRSLGQYFTLEGRAGLIAVGKAHASLMPRKVYERVRAQSPVSRPRTTPAPSVRFSYEKHLHVDLEDPLLSDHPSDHITAVQAIAGVERAAADIGPQRQLRALKIVFQHYIDIDPVPTLRLREAGESRFLAEVIQQGAVRARATGKLTIRGVV